MSAPEEDPCTVRSHVGEGGEARDGPCKVSSHIWVGGEPGGSLYSEVQ